MIGRVMVNTKTQVKEEKRGFRSGRGSIDHTFIMRQLVWRYREKRKPLYVAFMDLEKA